jgi:acyl carrier protein
MTAADARSLMLRCLGEIAPDADLATLAGDADVRTALDLDSMDMFNLMTMLSEQAGIDIPDHDAGRLVTVDGAVAYLSGAEVAGG